MDSLDPDLARHRPSSGLDSPWRSRLDSTSTPMSSKGSIYMFQCRICDFLHHRGQYFDNYQHRLFLFDELHPEFHRTTDIFLQSNLPAFLLNHGPGFHPSHNHVRGFLLLLF